MAEVTGHFQNEEGAGDRGAHGGCEEGNHADDDDVWRVDFIDHVQRDEDIRFHCTYEGADDEEGEEEAARYAAAVGNQCENIFSRQQEQEEAEAVTGHGQGIHQGIAAAQHLGQVEAQEAGADEGETDFHILVSENFEAVEISCVEKAPVEDDACEAAGNSNDDYEAQMFRGHGDEVYEMEARAVSKEETGDDGGRNGAGHGREEHGP